MDTESQSRDTMSMVNEVDGTADERLRARIHNLADLVHRHEIQLAEHRIMIDSVREDLKGMATSAQLAAALEMISHKLTTATATMDLKVQQINASLSELVRGKNWVVGLVLSAVILGLLGLVLRKPGP